jgi:hypothetical protein
LRQLLARGLEQTEAMWPAVKEGFALVHEVAGVLANKDGRRAKTVRRRRVREVVGRIQAKAGQAEQQGEKKLAAGLGHFAKAYGSYEPGLYHCYSVADVPRTNNDLEQAFGSHRYHERRASGRKVASPGLVVRGSVRLVAGLATRLRARSGEELAPARLEDWRSQRAELERRRLARVSRRRFRRNPKAYLRDLEKLYRQSGLPS